jgi:uncharacterized protein
MAISRFSANQIQHLGHYVYLYIDPRDNKIFYVGKGYGNRVFEHLDDKSETEKVQKINDIKKAGKEPQIDILIHGLEDGTTAHRIESSVIDTIGISTLTNEIRGPWSKDYGRIDVQLLASIYESEKGIIEEPAILIRINKLYRHGMSDIELYDASRGVWKVGSRREHARYAFAVFEGIVREVYKIKEWHPAGSTFSRRGDLYDPDRWEFVGDVAEKDIRDKYILKSVEGYFAKNSQNPITYVNC